MEEDFGSANYRPAPNRGQKLKPRALEPPFASATKPSLLHSHLIDERTKFENAGQRRIVVKKNGVARRAEDIEESPYAGIDVEELWSNIERPEDVIRHKPAVTTLRSRSLAILAQAAMDVIEEEARRNRILSMLSAAISMDDPGRQDVNPLKDVPEDVKREFQDVVQETVCCSNELIRNLSSSRSKLVEAYRKKKSLAKRLAPFERKEDSLKHKQHRS
ncbi:hypothetical protein HK101_003275 [Irineochytrium annulatum]|nr:hypothetical protein HK101_003275 [Irineochytrium annulatum]